MRFVGIDICKGSFDCAIGLANGKHRTKSKFPNSAKGFDDYLRWHQQHAADAAVGMEATGIYHEKLAEYLVDRGVTVYVFNPAQVAADARSQLTRTKTDRVDAKLIADFCVGQHARGRLGRPWQPLPPTIRTLRALAKRLDDLKEMRQIELNRLDVCDGAVQDSIKLVIRQLEQEIGRTETAIREHIDDDPDLRSKRELLETIPGIAETTSAWLLGVLSAPRHFANARQVEAFFGLNPRLRESGTLTGQARISKTGDARLRAKLYMPALVAMRHNPSISALRDRLRAKGKPGLLIVVAAMRKLLNLAYGVLRSGRPFDPRLAIAG